MCRSVRWVLESSARGKPGQIIRKMVISLWCTLHPGQKACMHHACRMNPTHVNACFPCRVPNFSWWQQQQLHPPTPTHPETGWLAAPTWLRELLPDARGADQLVEDGQDRLQEESIGAGVRLRGGSESDPGPTEEESMGVRLRGAPGGGWLQRGQGAGAWLPAPRWWLGGTPPPAPAPCTPPPPTPTCVSQTRPSIPRSSSTSASFLPASLPLQPASKRSKSTAGVTGRQHAQQLIPLQPASQQASKQVGGGACREHVGAMQLVPVAEGGGVWQVTMPGARGCAAGGVVQRKKKNYTAQEPHAPPSSTLPPVQSRAAACCCCRRLCGSGHACSGSRKKERKKVYDREDPRRGPTYLFWQ